MRVTVVNWIKNQGKKETSLENAKKQGNPTNQISLVKWGGERNLEVSKKKNSETLFDTDLGTEEGKGGAYLDNRKSKARETGKFFLKWKGETR